MTRPDGFPTADHDVGFLTDARILDAVDLSGPAAVVAYLAVRDASWARGERVQLPVALRQLPASYQLGDLDGLLQTLQRVGLLDPQGRIPESSWAVWFLAAANRRQARRESGRLGGLAKAGKRRSSNGKATPQRKAGDALPDRPTDDPTDVGSVEGFTVGRPLASSGAEIYCLAYDDHRSQHRRAYTGGPFLCAVCGPRPGPAFRDAMEAAGAKVGGRVRGP